MITDLDLEKSSPGCQIFKKTYFLLDQKMNKQINNRKNRQKLKKIREMGWNKKNIKKIAFFMIGIYGSFMVLEFRSLDFGQTLEEGNGSLEQFGGKLEQG